MVVAQARKVSSGSASKLTDKEVKEFAVYKPYLLFWALIDLIITMQFKVKSQLCFEPDHFTTHVIFGVLPLFLAFPSQSCFIGLCGFIFQNVPEQGGCTVLANYIRHNDKQLLDNSEQTLSQFQVLRNANSKK